MPQIVVENLSKAFRVAQRAPGLRAALAGLFVRKFRNERAVDGVSFAVEAGELVGYIGPTARARALL